MDEKEFEGTLVLEKLAAVGRVEDFFEAVDADDFEKARKLLRQAGVDAETIRLVTKQMSES